MVKDRGHNAWNIMHDEEDGNRDAYEEFREEGADRRRNQRVNPEDRNQRDAAMEEVLQLYNSDHPGLQLVSEQLDGKNFLNWRKSVRRALGARSKLDLLDGTIAKLDATSPYYKSWIKVDYMISSWIINSISKEVATAFNHIDTTHKLWLALNHRFNRSNGPKIARLQREIGGYMQGNQSVLTYFNNLTSLCNELDMVQPPIDCVCHAHDVIVDRLENQRLMQFLNGLNDSYEQARNQVLFLDPLPNLDKAYSMILQVEDQKITNDTYGDGSGLMAMNVGNQKQQQYTNNGKQYQFKGRKTREERMNLYCTHCHKPGHEEKECFKLHGTPEWYTKLKESRGKLRVNLAEISTQNISNSATGKGVETNPEMGKLVQDEVARCLNQLLVKSTSDSAGSSSQLGANMVQSGITPLDILPGYYAFGVSNGVERNKWIIDSGASVHICCNDALMSSLVHLPVQQDIHLPDGSVQKVLYKGTVRITAEIVLYNVLLAPQFTHNLISVAQLTQENQAKFLFLPTHCVIQKQDTDHILGMGYISGNLYIVDANMPNHSISGPVTNVADYHSLLGHPFIAVMEHITGVKGLLTSDKVLPITNCEVCALSKQTRSPLGDLMSCLI